MKNNISVAMTSYNGARYIEAQIGSVLAQTLQPAEIIICDDGSDDGTIEILADYEKKGQIKYSRNDSKLGVIKNFKKAVSLCDPNNYIALCDQDDYWLPEKLQLNMAAMQSLAKSGTPSIVYSDLSLVDEQLKMIASSFWRVLNINPEKERFQSLLFGNFITGCTIMMNREMSSLLLEMPETGIMMHDAWLGLIAFTFGNCKFIGQPLVLYRQHGANVTYETTNANNGIKEKLIHIYENILNGHGFLADEIEMAKTFLAHYSDHLSQKQKEIFNKFIALEQTGFMKKKIYRVVSRSYRLSNLF